MAMRSDSFSSITTVRIIVILIGIVTMLYNLILEDTGRSTKGYDKAFKAFVVAVIALLSLAAIEFVP